MPSVTVNTDTNERDKCYDYMVRGGSNEPPQSLINRLARSGLKLSSLRKELPGAEEPYGFNMPVLVVCKGPAAGCILAISQDDEGNGAGAIHVQTG